MKKYTRPQTVNLFYQILLYFLLITSAFAEKRIVRVSEVSSSGKSLMINAGARDGLSMKEAVLVRAGDQKLVAARVIRLFEGRSAVYIVEDYGGAQPNQGEIYNILYGIPLGNIPNLPSDVESAEWLPANPGDEKFFTSDGKELLPEIGDEDYMPENRIAPKFPPVDYSKPHNISIGLEIFRDSDLTKTLVADSPDAGASTTYQGLSVRYSYNYQTYYWLKKRLPAILGIEGTFGEYSFPLTVDGENTEVQVFQLGALVKYMIKLNQLFYVYPYAGLGVNMPGSLETFPSERLEDLRGTRVFLGAGGMLVMSKVIDLRMDIGLEGLLFALVVKF